MDFEEFPNLCPKCGSPREPEFTECSHCGIIFQRFDSSKDTGVLASLAGSVPSPGAKAPVAPDPVTPAAGSESAPPEDPLSGEITYSSAFSEDPLAEEVSENEFSSSALPPAVLYRRAAEAEEEERERERTAEPSVNRRIERELMPNDAFGGLLNRNLGTVLILVLVLRFSVWAFYSTKMLAIGNFDQSKEFYAEITGKSLPERFHKGFMVTMVGRQAALFEEGASENKLVVFHGGPFTWGEDQYDLEEWAYKMMDLFELPWTKLTKKDKELSELEVTVQILRLGPGKSALRGYLTAFEDVSGGPSMMLIVAPSGLARKIAREVFDD